jgi:hypothetical protein
MRSLSNFELACVSGGNAFDTVNGTFGDEDASSSSSTVSGMCVAATAGTIGTVGSATRSPTWDNITKAAAAVVAYVGSGCAEQMALSYGDATIKLIDAGSWPL